MTDQEHPLEYLPELALGVLAEEDAPGIRAHLAECATCRAEYETMSQAARLLPYVVEDMEPSASVRDGLMERIASEPRLLRRQNRWPAWQKLSAIAAAAAVLVVGGWFAGSTLGGSSDSSLKAENGRQHALVEAVAEGTARRETSEQDGVSAVLVYAPGSSEAFAWMQNLPALPSGKAFQAWFIADGSPKPSQVFSSPEGGVWVRSPGDVASFGAFALTIEDKAGASAPTQQPFLVMTLGTAASRLPFTAADWRALTTED
ncbi:MAG: anti-sigma factor [Tepidiformaceae bacterium]